MKYKSIPLSEVREGDEVYSVLRGWGKVVEIRGDITSKFEVRFPCRFDRISRYTNCGFYFQGDLNPEITEARREVKTVTREMWGVMYRDGTVLHCNAQPTPEMALEFAKKVYLGSSIIPCKITWEEEE